MNHNSGPDSTPPVFHADDRNVLPNWRTALADLIGARAALVQLEFRQAAQSGAKRGALWGAAAFLLILAWIILVAGTIGAISASAGWPWYWVTLSAGGVHLLIAAILIFIARNPGPALFEVTKAEFKKDREWLANFQSPSKSND